MTARDLRPPRLARWLAARLIAPGPGGAPVLGDLHEEHADVAGRRGRLVAHLWYWGRVVGLLVGYPGRIPAAAAEQGREVRLAARTLLRTPGLTLSIVGTVALGIGAGTAIFSVVDAVLFRPLPFAEPQQLVRVQATDIESGRDVDLMYSDLEPFGASVSGFASAAGFSVAPRRLHGPRLERPEEVSVARTWGDLFGTLGVEPVAGRLLRTSDAREIPDAVVLSHRLWTRRFGGDPAIVGARIHLEGEGFRVVGVLPQGRRYPESADLWRPLRPDEMLDDDREVHLVARIAPGRSVVSVDQEVRAVAEALAADRPGTHGDHSAWVQPLKAVVVRDVDTALVAFLGAVGLVLLITCVNTANLLLAREAGRRAEVAIRASLGSGRWRVVRMRLTESMLLALAGGALGLLVGRVALDLVLSVAPPLPRAETIALDLRVVGVMAGVTTLAGLAFGIAPALQTASTDPRRVLNGGGGRRGATRPRARLQSGLVTLEVALSTLLAVIAVLLVSTFQSAVRYDRGFDASGLVAFDVEPLHPPQPGDEARAFWGDLLESLRGLPDVEAVGASSHSPLETRGLRFPVTVEGGGREAGGELATTRIVSAGFFAALGLPALRGRLFEGEDAPVDEPELVVNERFVRTFLDADTEPLGTTVGTGWFRGRIVGVVADVAPNPRDPPQPFVYASFEQQPLGGALLLVRTRGEPRTLVAAAQAVIAERVESPLGRAPSILDDEVAASVQPERFNTTIVLAFALLALVLSALGVHGVTAFTVSAQRDEIGIRRALGASRASVAKGVLKRVLLLSGVGVFGGVVGALVAARALASLLYGVTPTDPHALAGAAAALLLVSFVAAAGPVARAVGVRPTEALRA